MTRKAVGILSIVAFALVLGWLWHASARPLPPGKAARGAITAIPDELTIGSGQKILTLDPDLAADGYSEGIIHLIGGTLYELDGAGALTPLLVASRSVSPDGLTWTFELKPALRFSDGTLLTSKDVKATFDRARADAQNVYRGFLSPVTQIEAPNPLEIVVRLSRPYPSLPVVLSQPEMTILPAGKLAAGPSFFDKPVSAGPFALQTWGGGMTAILVRNPNYAGAEPAVRRLIFQTIDDFNARLVQVQSGQLALALDIPPRLLRRLSGTLVACSTPRYGFISLPLNVDRPPLDEVAVRRAISKAIDREEIERTVWAGRITPIAGFWPSIMDGYDRRMPVARDIAGARRELQTSSCRNGCSVRLMYSPPDPWVEPTAIIVAQNLEEIGIDVHLERVDDATFNERLGRGDFGIAVSFLYDYNNIPDGLLTYALRTDGGLRANFSGFDAPADLRRAMDAAVTADGAARTAALAEVNRLFSRYQPFITLSDYTVGCVSRYAPSVVRTDASGYVDVARRVP